MTRIRWGSLLGLWLTTWTVTVLLDVATGFKLRWWGFVISLLICIFWPYKILKENDNDGSQG